MGWATSNGFGKEGRGPKPLAHSGGCLHPCKSAWVRSWPFIIKPGLTVGARSPTHPLARGRGAEITQPTRWKGT